MLQALDVDTWGRPAALGAVFQDAAEKKELMPVQEFLEVKESIYTKRWIPAVPSAWQVVSWGFRQIGLTGSNPSQLAEADFAVVQNIEAAATALQKKMEEVAYSPVTQCYSLEMFRNTFAYSLDDKLPLSASDITLLLTYCSRDRPILQYDPASSTVKLSTQAPLDETDVSIAQIRTQEVALEKQMTILEEKVAADDTAIRTAVSRKDMNKARTLLRSKKLAEAALEQRRQNDIKLKEILFSIEKAQDSVAMMAIMTRSTGALRLLNKQIGGVERVDEVAEQLREEMEKGEDVQRALDQIGAESVAIDEDEVDEEFAALERQEWEKEEAARRKIVEDKAREEAEQTARSMKELDELDLARRTAEDGETKGEAQDINGGKDDVEDVLSQSIDRLNKLNLANGQAEATAEQATSTLR